MSMDPRDNTMPDNTTGSTPADEPDVEGVDEQDIPVEQQLNDILCLTPHSAVGGLEVDSFPGSGPVIWPDFRTTIRDAWGVFESGYAEHGKPRMGEAIPEKLREGRRAFKALLDRFEHDGFSSDLAYDLYALSNKYTPYRVVEVSYILPDGLDDLLDTAYGRLDDDEEDEAARASAPPRDEFDLNNPKHLGGWRSNLSSGTTYSEQYAETAVIRPRHAALYVPFPCQRQVESAERSGRDVAATN